MKRREMVQIASTGMFGLAALQGSEPPRKKRFQLGAVRSGHLLFVAGIGAGRGRDGAGDIRHQTADALDVMKAALEEAGASMADLVQVQVALVDAERNWEPMNEVYNTHVPEPRPVRSYFGTTGFQNAGQLLQIDAIAYVD